MATTQSQPTPAHELSGNAGIPTSTLDSNSTDSGSAVPRGPVTATLSFYQPPTDGSKPFNYVEPQPTGPQRNFSASDLPVTIADIRSRESSFTLDANAFAALAHVPSAMTYADWTSDAKVEETYYPEVERLLLSHLPGAHRVVLFDHTIRRAAPDAPRAPVTRVHIDQTPSSTAARVRRHLPAADAEALLRGRYRIVNVWRPLNGPVVSFPLAVADAATVRDEDLVPVEHRYPDRTGETAAVKYHPDQRWYYWSGMLDDERLLLKCYDSDESVGRWGRVPHTAFVDPRTPVGAPGRESIEIRALVFG